MSEQFIPMLLVDGPCDGDMIEVPAGRVEPEWFMLGYEKDGSYVFFDDGKRKVYKWRPRGD
jgi:hypothetical protein